MTIILGVDPGHNGAFVLYDTETQRITAVWDMPIWYQAVGKKKRQRIDAIALTEIMETAKLLGANFMVMEQVGGRTGQSASAGFVFGYGVGLVYMAALYNTFIVETISPMAWKKVLNVPGKSAADDSAILARADELFPFDRALFRGPKGGKLIDRAEAAMIALFGARYVLPTMADKISDPEYDMVYNKKADTGA